MLDLCNSGRQLWQNLCEFGNTLSLHGILRAFHRADHVKPFLLYGKCQHFSLLLCDRGKAASFALALCNGAFQLVQIKVHFTDKA